MSALKKWRGLKALVQDVVEHGSSAIERVHRATAERPFRILEKIPPIAAPTRIVRAIHDVAMTTSYASVRLVNRVVGASLDVVLDAVETRAPSQDEP